ncbi:MAG TPA: sterol-binding protein [Actinocrinis sp.]
MATKDECAAALERLAANLAGTDDERFKTPFERSVTCLVPDLGVTFHGTLKEGRLHGITAYQGGGAPAGQLKLTIGSDDLVRLVNGQLNFASGWASGKVKVSASFSDLLRLRKLL